MQEENRTPDSGPETGSVTMPAKEESDKEGRAVLQNVTLATVPDYVWKRIAKPSFFARHPILAVLLLLFVLGLAFGLVRGLNYGIDFTGGTMVQIDMGKEVAMEEVEAVLNDRGIEAEVVYAGENNEQIMIRTVDAIENDERSALIADLQQEFGFDDSDILAQELFGPTVGKELRNNAIKAVLLAAVGMLIYIRLRF